jgi:hypothetical protein
LIEDATSLCNHFSVTTVNCLTTGLSGQFVAGDVIKVVEEGGELRFSKSFEKDEAKANKL